MTANKLAAASIGGVLGCMVAVPAFATSDVELLIQEVRRLSERVEHLEATNRRLEASAGASARVEEVVARVEDVENEVLAIRRQPKPFESLDGVAAGASLVMVAQRASSGTVDGHDESQLNYRADVEVELPAGNIGDAEGKLFAHFRLGQGGGLGRLNPTYTGAVNSIGFELENGGVAASGDSVALMAQAWYQLDIPVGFAGKGEMGRVEVTVGKIDPFVFFDQNNIADDESEAFLNNVFVHNPLLDSGSDVGADLYGFSPGARFAYVGDVNGTNNWGVSLGLFGSGNGAHFDTSFSKPFLIAQAEYNGKTWRGLEGGYRLYAWSNGRSESLAGDEERHAGWGISADQRVARGLTLFGRLGQSTRGEVRFDRAFTLGGQLDGTLWGRAADRAGLALGWLRTSNEFRDTGPDDDGDGIADYRPRGAERQAELYYAWQLNDNLQISPSVQWIGRPGGDADADAITVWSLRAKAAF